MIRRKSNKLGEASGIFKPSQEVKIDRENLKKDQVTQLEKLLDRFSEVFSHDDEDIGSSDFIHRIELFDYTPVKSRA